jgi:hypothetical protein
MQNRWFLLLMMLFAVPTVWGATGTTNARFSVPSQTLIPGQTLPAGSYTIQVVDRLSDRMIVRVAPARGKAFTFLALPSSSLSKPAAAGPIVVKGGADAKAALRGFLFPDGTIAEFVYPKATAVSLAKANDTTVPAIDPASEGRVDAPQLSKDDLQMVTLWMLSPVPVGPNDAGPGVKAERYRQVASAKVPPAPKSRPAVAVLPHTASDLPVILLLGFSSLTAAALLRRRRLGLNA